MKGKLSRKGFDLLLLLLCLATPWVLDGCSTQGYSVIASTATVIGVNLSQQPTNGVLDATLGYKRAELAFVPTNRSGGESAQESTGGGAGDATDVIMELRYDGIFATSDKGGIYQRLAVGKNAVSQKGAAIMFAKNQDGTTNAEALRIIQGMPVTNPTVEQEKAGISRAYEALKGDQAKEKLFLDAVREVNPAYQTVGQFLSDAATTLEQVQKVKQKLKDSGIAIS